MERGVRGEERGGGEGLEGGRQVLQVESTLFSFSSSGVCCTHLHLVVHKLIRTRPGGHGLTVENHWRMHGEGWEHSVGANLVLGRKAASGPAPMSPNMDTEQEWWALSGPRLVARAGT